MTHTTRAFFGLSLLSLGAATVLHLLVLFGAHTVWQAAVHMALFGWITGMILAVNYHTMPVFAGRDFPFPGLLQFHLATFFAGVSLTSGGFLLGNSALVAAGLLLELIASLVFVVNSVSLFIKGRPRPHRPAPLPIRGQSEVDRLATQATKGAALALPVALLLLLGVQLRWIGGAWLLAGEHLAALGWMMLMVVGVGYHVLPRFSGKGVRGTGWVRTQLLCHNAGLLLMVPALGFNWLALFAIGSTLMALAVVLFVWTIWSCLQVLEFQQQPPPMVKELLP